MSAAQAVLIETSPYLDASNALPLTEHTLRDLIHELRQPLSSIEAIAYYLEMTLPPDQIDARLYMRRLEQLVDQASAVLEDAGERLRKRAAAAGAA